MSREEDAVTDIYGQSVDDDGHDYFVTSQDGVTKVDDVIDDVTRDIVGNASGTTSNDTGNWTTAVATAVADMRYPMWAAVLIVIACTLIMLGTILGNLLVCTAVSIVRKLRTPSNWLIVSLALADLFVAVAVMPLATMYEVMGRWDLSQTVCDMWTSLDVMLCTASILNLCMISVDRYFVITRPFQYAMKRTPLRMAMMILSVWILSALISIPPLFGWKADPVPFHCELSQAIGYQFYATIGAFYLPLTVMIIIYYRIYTVSARILKAEAKSKLPPADGRRSSYLPNDGAGRRPSSYLPSTSSRKFSTASQSQLVGGCNNSRRLDVNDLNHQTSTTSSGGGFDVQYSRNSSIDVSPKTPLNKKNFSFLQRPSLHRLSSASRERKTTKTLGVIMGAFTACWLPFFILALIRPFLNDPTIIPHWLGSLLQWLGFANSFFNPIIYARFNREFRTPFKEILFGRCRGINVRLRSESYTEQYGNGPMPMDSCRGGPIITAGGAGNGGGVRPGSLAGLPEDVTGYDGCETTPPVFITLGNEQIPLNDGPNHVTYRDDN